METRDATIAVRLGFMPPSQAIPDPDRPGLLRAGPRSSAPYGSEGIEFHTCLATDGCQDDTLRPDFLEMGFDTVDLSAFEDLQRVLERVTRSGRITDEDDAAIRAALNEATLVCGSSTVLTVDQIADEHVVMRRSGPNGMVVVGPGEAGPTLHSASTSIHADQDVYGMPLARHADGRSPSLLRHNSPDGRNHDSRTMIVNVWIPLHQITQPLVLADGRSIDRRRHQLRYGLPTSPLLDRYEEQSIDDTWTFLHDPSQRWYLRSDMDHRTAYVFDTLSTPHGAGTLPGEALAEQCYRALEEAEAAVEAGDVTALTEALGPATAVEIPDDVTPALRAAIAEMVRVAEVADRDPAAVCGEGADAWSTASRTARDRVIRTSLEVRVLVLVD
ncbi:MAG: hypothetical protein KF703_02185 [Actinobacteria bacterium]|nr:hypothetical protein [Actinomycetota bacterium]